MNILLVEPNNILGKAYLQSLEQAGHEVLWCTSGQMGLLAADNEAPDVVVLELQLPGHNGIEFLYEFRSYRDWQAIPIVVHTFVPEALSPQQRSQLNIISYLYKPATKLASLTRTVNDSSASVLI